MKACAKWLGEIGCGMTWDQHMQATVDKWECVQAEEWNAIAAENVSLGNGVRLYEIGTPDA